MLHYVQILWGLVMAFFLIMRKAVQEPAQKQLAAGDGPPPTKSPPNIMAPKGEAEVTAASVSEDSDEDDQEISPHLEVTQRHRLQNAQFEALLTKHATTEPSQTAGAPLPTVPDSELSTARLIAKKDIGAGALDPREYQIELFERAKARNTIAVLDTGSGKTLIAVLLLKHVIKTELVDRANGKAHRVSFFLVDSVTLVFQQAAVLRNNIDQNVAHFFGAMGTDLWDKQTWDEHLSKNMVIVCTAEILNQCLLNAFVRMDQINLLIFDEAHHTKKDHPYACIVRESYLWTQQSKRPRIFGMTASPIDAKRDIVEAATQLERHLDSQIATTSKLDALRQIVRKPTEETWIYKKLSHPSPTALYDSLLAKFGDIRALEPVFRFSLYASSELGKWCADQVWVYALSDDVLPKLEGAMCKESNCRLQAANASANEITRIKEAGEEIKAHVFNDPLAPGQLSPRVEVLLENLRKHFGGSKETKCIVFAERRNTAKLLQKLCETLRVPGLRPGVLVGVKNHDAMGSNISLRHQFLSLVKFRQGEINCLFATSVAEEGLDIPNCNLVVRFNLCDTLIQYVQSRGRARHVDSVYASMVEFGNEDHQARLQDVWRDENLMQKFCKALPEDRLLHGNDEDLDASLRKGEGEGARIYTIPSSGAKLTYRHAVDVLHRYAHSLRYENDVSAQVSYFVIAAGDKFTYEIILPEKSPIRGVIGGPASRKCVAKQSAAFDACLLLRKNGLLDEHFRSIYHKRLPAMRNAKLAITSKKSNQYKMRCKPSIWARGQGVIPSLLYVTIITFAPAEPLPREHGKIALLTRERLPEFPTFPVYLERDIETDIETMCIDKELPVAVRELDSLTTFTVSVLNHVFHKTYEREPEKFPYWIAPVREDVEAAKSSSPDSMIDWDSLHRVHQNPEQKWSADMNPQSLLSRFMYDDWSGKYRYFPVAIDYNLRASDPPPSDVAPRKNMQDILNYTLSLSKNSREKFLERYEKDQPVLRAEQICLRRNFLDKAVDEEHSKHAKCVICPQPLTLSSIPLPTVASCLAFPAIISRLESYLIILEGCELLGLDIKPEYALEAFTKDTDSSEEHRSLQIHVQRGMGKNYERFEFLGDSFLKMATSIALFSQRPNDDEYDFHVSRMCLICNKNLFNAATKLGVYEYIRSRGFSRNTWFPPGLQLLRGRNPARYFISESKHALAEKTIADVCEALIGASIFSTGSGHRFDMAVKAVTIFVDHEDHTATSWKDYRSAYSLPQYQTEAADGAEADLAQKIFEKLGYRFRYPRLLRSAFTHPSYPAAWAKVPCYQRLEFLGDALLEMVCVEDLFHRFPDKDPQWLTEHKMAMVSNKFLGALAVKLGFHTHLQHFSNPIQSQITHCAEDIQLAEAESDGAMDYWLATKDSPKCLPDMLEAYLAAIFVDSDFDFTVIQAFFDAHIKPYFHDMSIYDTFANRHPTTYLHSRLTNLYGCTNFCVKSGEIPTADGEPVSVLAAVMVHGESIAQAVASSSRYAKVKASEKALWVIDGLLRLEFRAKYHCDCKETEEDLEIGTAV
ncbi:hypothetical protein NUU61_003969 [Penicillium alfredii]|uniref:Dicer-like protein 1 n=1 Tax=Penicillium alfredii TaxID=1506179 RepID=A0A9W9KE68_9EURO|nr:uncharacterized protein NUU61_003969 [Penicillium alfredii]KAJ5101747.1 hypothetical protein NUU61_003969 [Penicillium alfredii]